MNDGKLQPPNKGPKKARAFWAEVAERLIRQRPRAGAGIQINENPDGLEIVGTAKGGTTEVFCTIADGGTLKLAETRISNIVISRVIENDEMLDP